MTNQQLELTTADVICGECQKPVGANAVVFDGWARCRACINAWVNSQFKLTGEKAHDLVQMLEVECKDCEQIIEPKGPVVVFVLETGEIGTGFCGRCVVNHRAAFADQAMREEVYTRVSYSEKGRSRGLLTKELMRDGKQYVVIKTTMDAMIEEGVLGYARGILTIPEQL